MICTGDRLPVPDLRAWAGRRDAQAARSRAQAQCWAVSSEKPVPTSSP